MMVLHLRSRIQKELAMQVRHPGPTRPDHAGQIHGSLILIVLDLLHDDLQHVSRPSRLLQLQATKVQL